MPGMSAGASTVIFSGLALLPTVSRTVDDGEVTFRVRRVAAELELCGELSSADTGRACTLTLPRMHPGMAVALAKALLEMATGHEVDLSALPDQRNTA